MGRGRLRETGSEDSWLLSQPDAALPQGQEQNLQLPGSGSGLAQPWEKAGAACQAPRLMAEGEQSQLDPVLCSQRSQPAPELPLEKCPVQGRAPQHSPSASQTRRPGPGGFSLPC